MEKTKVRRAVSLFFIITLLLATVVLTVVSSAAATVQPDCGFNAVQLKAGSGTALSAGTTETVVWHTSSPSVATVSGGNVVAQKNGAAVVYVTQNTKVLRTWLVTVGDATGSLTLNLNETSVRVGTTATLTASGASVTWESSDAAIATVSTAGTVKGISTGNAMIYAKSTDGTLVASCMVHVLQSIGTLSKTTAKVAVGQTFYNKYTTTAGEVTWTSADPSIATVNNGFIVGVKAGETVVSASTSDGTGAQCTVTVTAAEPIYAAYLSPNNVVAGEETEAVVVASPNATGIGVLIYDTANSTVLKSAAATTHEDKTVNGRTVRIWRTKITPDTTGSYKLYAYASDAVSEKNVNLSKAFGVPIYVRSAEDTGIINSASESLLEFLAKNEGLCKTVQYDVVHVATIGYGRALYAGDTFYNNQTSEEAWGNMVLLVNKNFTSELNTFIKHYSLQFTQQQYDALMDFAYNMGAYCWRNYDFYLRRLLIENYQKDDGTSSAASSETGSEAASSQTESPEQMLEQQLKYAFGRHSVTGGYFYTGLWRRRIDEWEMFLRGDYSMHSVVTEKTTDEFALPSQEDRNNPDKYKSDWTYVKAQY